MTRPVRKPKRGAGRLQLAPHALTEKAWWYEIYGGIEVVVEPHAATQTFRIRWQSLKPSVNRISAARRLK